MRNGEDVEEFIRVSGNVFADLGLKDPEERLAKARLASRIQDELEARGWAPNRRQRRWL